MHQSVLIPKMICLQQHKELIYRARRRANQIDNSQDATSGPLQRLQGHCMLYLGLVATEFATHTHALREATFVQSGMSMNLSSQNFDLGKVSCTATCQKEKFTPLRMIFTVHHVAPPYLKANCIASPGPKISKTDPSMPECSICQN